MPSRNGFTLTEILIAMVLSGLIILTATSVDITSRRFFSATNKQARVQDEAKIAMEHITKKLQLGIGDVDNRGFSISGGGSQIQVRLDYNADGRFTAAPPDRIIEYSYQGSPDYKIVYDPDIGNPGDEELLAESIVNSNIFRDGSALNQVDVNITVRSKPADTPSLENPETTLTSSIVLRAMSCN